MEPMHPSSRIPRPSLVLSVVSHGHAESVSQLLKDLIRVSQGSVTRVVLTLNVPEDETILREVGTLPFVLQLRRNARPLGFGVNHNRALRDATEDCVCVLNPDVRFEGSDPFLELVETALRPPVGCAYPLQVDEAGRVQDSERALPTLAALWRRRALGRSDARTDWVNAACLVFARPVWERLGGFDERYFMYCEDVDISLRVRLMGLTLQRVQVHVVHIGQRASHRLGNHFLWHLASFIRLWRSPVYKSAKQLLTVSSFDAGTITPP